MEFTLDGIQYTVQQDEYESENLHALRCFFIAYQRPKTEKEENNAIQYSKYWINYRKYNTIYINKVMDKIKRMESNIPNIKKILQI